MDVRVLGFSLRKHHMKKAMEFEGLLCSISVIAHHLACVTFGGVLVRVCACAYLLWLRGWMIEGWPKISWCKQIFHHTGALSIGKSHLFIFQWFGTLIIGKHAKLSFPWYMKKVCISQIIRRALTYLKKKKQNSWLASTWELLLCL